MGPYQTMPNYVPYQPMQQPYADRLAQLQQFQQNLQTQQIPFINQLPPVVESIEVVKTREIPMDGNMYYFPKADGTEVYGKQWLSSGQTRILTFKPVLEDEVNNSPLNGKNLQISLSDEATEVFMKQFEELKQRLDGIEQFVTKSLTKTSGSTTKKES